MIEAKYAEIRGLFKGNFRAVLRTELRNRANLITARYVLYIKSDEDKEERYNARTVAGEHLNIMKDYLLHSTQHIQYVSVRIILVVVKIKGFRKWVVDVKLAYLQSDKPPIRRMFITNPAPEFKLSPEECLELFKSIYGLAEPRDEWY